jgi:hypothetical protein
MTGGAYSRFVELAEPTHSKGGAVLYVSSGTSKNKMSDIKVN